MQVRLVTLLLVTAALAGPCSNEPEPCSDEEMQRQADETCSFEVECPSGQRPHCPNVNEIEGGSHCQGLCAGQCTCTDDDQAPPGAPDGPGETQGPG